MFWEKIEDSKIFKKFKKGEYYSPDDLTLLPNQIVHKYFTEDDEKIGFLKEYEIGSGLCLESFKILIEKNIKICNIK